MRVSTFLATAGFCLFMLPGCGIKGALYLPEVPEPPQKASTWMPDSNKQPATR